MMNANKFWAMQLKKNEGGRPKYVLSTDPNTPEDELVSAWINKWQEQFAYFYNKGCGCCINLYEFDAPDEAVNELPEGLFEMYRDVNTSPLTGSPSNFREWSSQATKPKNSR